jgi:hypothetical protein
LKTRHNTGPPSEEGGYRLRDLRLVFDAYVGKFSEVVVEGGYGGVLGHGGCGDETVDETDFGLSVAFQGVEMNCGVTDLDAGAGNEGV